MGTNSNRSAGTQSTKKGIVQGTALVDPTSGDALGVVTDTNGVRRLAVDANFVAQNVQATVDVRYTDGDSVAIGDPTTNTIIRVETDGSINANIISDAATGDNIGLKVENRTITPSDTQYNKRITGITGSTNTDTTSLDVSIHDHNGNQFTTDNRFPVNSRHETEGYSISGNCFTAVAENVIANSTLTNLLAISNPSASGKTLRIFCANCDVDPANNNYCKFQFYLGATGISGGTIVTPTNHLSGSVTVSLASVVYSPTITSIGKLVGRIVFPGGNVLGSQTFAEKVPGYWVLPPGQNMSILGIAKANNVPTNLFISWEEV